jgi:hypothetical protein
MKLKVLLAFAVLCSLFGCAGNGVVLQDMDSVDAHNAAFARAFNTKNFEELSALFSEDFLEDCADKAMILEGSEFLFTSPEVARMELVLMPVTNRVIDDAAGTASYDMSGELTVYNTEGEEMPLPIERSVFLKRENGVWKEIGNQTCDEE